MVPTKIKKSVASARAREQDGDNPVDPKGHRGNRAAQANAASTKIAPPPPQDRRSVTPPAQDRCSASQQGDGGRAGTDDDQDRASESDEDVRCVQESRFAASEIPVTRRTAPRL